MELLLGFVQSGVIEAIIFTILIATLVSIDVAGLILSQHRDFAIDEKTKQSRKDPSEQARIHAITHASLFLIYMIGISIFAWLFDLVMKLLGGVAKGLTEFVAKLLNIRIEVSFAAETFADSIVLLIGVVIVIVVWTTYSDKIVEDHSEKIKDPANPLSKQRWDVRAIYRAIKTSNRFRGDRLLDIALALAVAVDMLAISAVIRVYFEGTFDSGYQGFHVDFFGGWLVEARTEELLLCFTYADLLWCMNIGFFTILTGLVVFRIARWFAIKASTADIASSEFSAFGWEWRRFNSFCDRKFEGYHNFRLYALRLAEPLLILFVLSEALFHLMAAPEEAPPFLGFQFPLEIALAFTLWICLVSAQGWGRIKDKVIAGAAFETPPMLVAPEKTQKESELQSGGSGSGETGVAEVNNGAGGDGVSNATFWEILRNTLSAYAHVPFVIFFALAFMALFAGAHAVEDREPLMLFANLFSFLVGVCVLFILFSPLAGPDIEAHFDKRYYTELSLDDRKWRRRFFGGLLLGVLFILLFLQLNFGYHAEGFFSEVEPSLVCVFLLFVFVIGSGLLVSYRSFRNTSLILVAKNRQQFSNSPARFSDFLSSIGVVSLVWQVYLVISLLG